MFFYSTQITYDLWYISIRKEVIAMLDPNLISNLKGQEGIYAGVVNLIR